MYTRLLELGIFEREFALDSCHNSGHFSHGTDTCMTLELTRNASRVSTYVTAHQLLLDGIDYANVQLVLQDIEVFGREFVLIHEYIHRWGHEHWIVDVPRTNDTSLHEVISKGLYTPCTVLTPTNRLSLKPLAILANVFADSGAITNRSAQRRNCKTSLIHYAPIHITKSKSILLQCAAHCHPFSATWHIHQHRCIVLPPPWHHSRWKNVSRSLL